jgi:catechol 2,3-dioxygenase-like lactoylglutathione lyase family enzyme
MRARLNVIGLVVEDLARSLAFYRRLGLEIPSKAEAQQHVEVTLSGDVRLAWDTTATIRSFTPEWKPPQGDQGISLAFELDSPAAVDAAYTEVVSVGHAGAKEPWDAFWGQRYAVVRDPDGNTVDLYAALEGQR